MRGFPRTDIGPWRLLSDGVAVEIRYRHPDIMPKAAGVPQEPGRFFRAAVIGCDDAEHLAAGRRRSPPLAVFVDAVPKDM